jgi:hypothetical protein
MKKLILLAALAALAMDVNAAEIIGLNCDGCSERTRYDKAMRVIDDGTVYVFDAQRAQVHKYLVNTITFEGLPNGGFTNVEKVSVERQLSTAYRNMINSADSLLEEGRIVLPPDFPIRSVGGALLDPRYNTTLIEDYLQQMSLANQLENNLSTFLLRLLRLKIPGLTGNLLIDDIILTFEFPDGSTLDFALKATVNSLSGEARMEAEVHGNARLADGTPAPTSSLGFRNQSFNDDDGSLSEWIEYARSMGIPVYNGNWGGGRARMECKVSGSRVVCRIILIR